jgi:hypothetical protein
MTFTDIDIETKNKMKLYSDLLQVFNSAESAKANLAEQSLTLKFASIGIRDAIILESAKNNIPFKREELEKIIESANYGVEKELLENHFKSLGKHIMAKIDADMTQQDVYCLCGMKKVYRIFERYFAEGAIHQR